MTLFLTNILDMKEVQVYVTKVPLEFVSSSFGHTLTYNTTHSRFNSSLRTKIKIIHLPLERKVILHKITNDDYKTTTELHGQVRQFQKNKEEVITKNFKEM